jgi:hypothetical protein
MKMMELTDEEVKMVEAKRESEKYAKTYTKRGILKHDLYCFDYDRYNDSESSSWAKYEAPITKKDIEIDSKIIKEFAKKFKDFYYLVAKKGTVLISANGSDWWDEDRTKEDFYIYDQDGKWSEENLTCITFEERK